MTDKQKKVMTNEEKAQKIIEVSNANMVYDIVDFNALHEAQMEDLIEMSEWKDQQHAEEKRQWVEKACEWLEDNANEYLDWYDWEQCRINKDELLYDFRKAMEEQL